MKGLSCTPDAAYSMCNILEKGSGLRHASTTHIIARFLRDGMLAPIFKSGGG